MWCRIRDSINYLGPAVKPRDDKFLSFLFCSLFKKKERCVILGLDPRIQVNRVARMRACIIITGLLRCARNDKREGVGQCGNSFLTTLTTPPLRGTPP